MDKNIKNLPLSDLYQWIKSGWLFIFIMGVSGMFLGNILQSNSKIYDVSQLLSIKNSTDYPISVEKILLSVEDIDNFDEPLRKCQSNIHSSIYGESVASGFRWGFSNIHPNQVSLKITGQNIDFLKGCTEIAKDNFKKYFDNEVNSELNLLNEKLNMYFDRIKCIQINKINTCKIYYSDALDKDIAIKYLSQLILELQTKIISLELLKIDSIGSIGNIKITERDANLLMKIATFFGFMIGSLFAIIFILLRNSGVFLRKKSN